MYGFRDTTSPATPLPKVIAESSSKSIWIILACSPMPSIIAWPWPVGSVVVAAVVVVVFAGVIPLLLLLLETLDTSTRNLLPFSLVIDADDTSK